MQQKYILAIDPGNAYTAFALIDENYNVYDKDKTENHNVLDYMCANREKIGHIVVEMIASYGMAVGAEVFETCVMIGMIERTADLLRIPRSRVFRQEEKLYICHDSRAKDANIRRALIDRFAKHDLNRGTGTKNNPDHFYGFKSDIWAAFAVGVVYLDKLKEEAVKRR
jgi:hypothetical protein